jgi:hypothetical protein
VPALPGFSGGIEKIFLVAVLPPAGEFVIVCIGHFGLAIGDKDEVRVLIGQWEKYSNGKPRQNTQDA